MKAILKDESRGKELLKSGYVVVPFLTGEEVQKLKSFYYQYHPKTLEGMYATAHLPDLAMRMQMNDAIKETFARAISEIFINANPLGGSFIAKGKGSRGTLKPHQDWNIVDEDHYRSFNIWVPLVDLSDDNGVICVIPGSHLWIKTFRSANIDSVYQNLEKELWDKMTGLYMKAGEALIYDHRLIHASGENNTDEIRLATVYGVIPDGADMFYYHRKDESTIEIYESNKEFFLYENIFEGPRKLKRINEFTYPAMHMTSDKINSLAAGRQGSLLGRIKSYLTSL